MKPGKMTQKTFAFTNHTLLPEALEKWPIDLFGRLLPRHLEIIFEINQRFMDQVRVQYLNDPAKLASLSLIDESRERYVRMANLACVGSYAINGVAALHTELLKQTTLKDFDELYPGKIPTSPTGSPPAAGLPSATPAWPPSIPRKSAKAGSTTWTNCAAGRLRRRPRLPCYWRQIKRDVKQPGRLHPRKNRHRRQPRLYFDVQVKRIHEYKRQHLNVLHIITLYERLKQNPNMDVTPRTFIFGGKAAPGYHMAKLMIKLITSVGDVINNDPKPSATG
jgi:starch phosphorylase